VLTPIITSEYRCLQVIALTSSLSVLLSASESLSLRAQFKEQGLFSWRIQRTRGSSLLRSRLLPLYDRIFDYPGVLWLFALQIISALLIPFGFPHRPFFATDCALIAAVTIVLSIRGNDGRTGADQMAKITFCSLALALTTSNIVVWRGELVFLTGQLMLSYATSGYLRIAEPSWRDGTALLLVLRQRTYGNRWCWELLRSRPPLLRCVSMSVLLFECLIPISVFLPLKGLVIFVLFGALFHILNAFIIGLNTFLWAYLGLYPALVWSWYFIHARLLNRN
jgi:hypothetical protein